MGKSKEWREECKTLRIKRLVSWRRNRSKICIELTRTFALTWPLLQRTTRTGYTLGPSKPNEQSILNQILSAAADNLLQLERYAC